MRQNRRPSLVGKNDPVVIDLNGSKVVKEVPAYQVTIDKIEIVSTVSITGISCVGL